MTNPLPAVCGILLAATVLLGSPGSGAAQEGLPRAGARNTINGNPVLYLFEWFNLEYQHVSNPQASFGLTGEYFGWDDSDAMWSLMGSLRFYPQEQAPEGFFLGGRVGAISQRYYDWESGPDEYAWDTNPGISLEVGYDWLLGSEKSFYLSFGGGITRVLGDSRGEDFWPILRIANVGWAF
jgi:hypothetical protein